MILDAITPKQPRLLVADLDGTLLHDAEVFEDRFITQRSIDTINRAVAMPECNSPSPPRGR